MNKNKKKKRVIEVCTIVLAITMSIGLLLALFFFIIRGTFLYIDKTTISADERRAAYYQALEEDGSVWVAEEIDAWFYVSDYNEEKYGGRAFGKIYIENEWKDALLLDVVSVGGGNNCHLSTSLVYEDAHETILTGGNISFTEDEIIYEGFSCYNEYFDGLDKITYKKLDSLEYKGKKYWSEDTDIEFRFFSDGIFEMYRNGTIFKGFIRFDCYDIILEVSEEETYVFNRGENGSLIYDGEKSHNDVLIGQYIFY